MKFIAIFFDQILLVSCIIILFTSLFLTLKSRFIQFRMFPQMFRLFVLGRKNGEEGDVTVRPHGALFTAMSTTIGISTIVSPFIAIRLGGPGAILGFLLATLFGAAVNFAEVTLALTFRKRKGNVLYGGPMQYLQDLIHPFLAKWYAFFGFILMMGWSAAQANQLSTILGSPLLGSFSISPYITGLFLACFITLILIGGIKRIANFSEKLVPVMFVIYVAAGLWIVFCNLGKMGEIVKMVFESCLTPKTFASGAAVGGIFGTLRWGIFKGLQSNEAGVGTQTFPHSMAEVKDPTEQGILAMVATFTAGFLCILSSLIALVTETWLDSTLSLGVTMVATSFQNYFSALGILIVLVSVFLFGFGTILGNSFNGSQCLSYLTNNRYLKFYYCATAGLIFWGSIAEVQLVWSVIDYCLVPVVVPHILALAYIAHKRPELLKLEQVFAQKQSTELSN